MACSSRSSPFNWFSRHSACCRIHPQPSWQFHGLAATVAVPSRIGDVVLHRLTINRDQTRQGWLVDIYRTCLLWSEKTFVATDLRGSSQIYIASVILVEEAHNAHPTTRPHVLPLLLYAQEAWSNESSRAKKARETSEKCKGAKAIRRYIFYTHPCANAWKSPKSAEKFWKYKSVSIVSIISIMSIQVHPSFLYHFYLVVFLQSNLLSESSLGSAWKGSGEKGSGAIGWYTSEAHRNA